MRDGWPAARDRRPAIPTHDRCGAPSTDIASRDDLTALLLDFYGRAFRDALLGQVFVDVARMDLAAHLPVICDFWETVLFRTGSYRRNALQPHRQLHARVELTPTHFTRWLSLWHATIDDRHAGPNAELAKLQAARIAGSMSRRLAGADSSARPAFIGPVRATPR